MLISIGRLRTLKHDLARATTDRDGFKNAYDQIQTTLGAVTAERDGYKVEYEKIAREIGQAKSEAVGYKNAYFDVVQQLDEMRAKGTEQLGVEMEDDRNFQQHAHLDAETHFEDSRAPSPSTANPVELNNQSDSGSPVRDTSLDQALKHARVVLDAGNRDRAVAAYMEIFRRSYGNGEAVSALMRLSKQYFADCIAARDEGDKVKAISLAVRALELHPGSGEIRDVLDMLLENFTARDMTKECLIFPDHARATTFYGDAIQTALDFAIYGGIVGDILEFGVLAGWTSRLFAERMRAGRFYGDLYLFDSFSGLPRNKEAIDRESYDVTRGVWDTEMELPQSLIDDIGAPIEVHISKMLSTVISPERIHIRKGFFSDSLKQPIRKKAAIVHLDCDLYQSTREVLDALLAYDVLQDGTVMMFDDWNCNRANPAFGQRRAMREFLEANADHYSASHYFNYGYNCAAFIIHDVTIVPTIDAQPTEAVTE